MQTEKVIEHIVNWLTNYAKNAGVKGFVVGVSGGIDSAVTSNLCALTGLPTLCLEMPIHQNTQQVNRAIAHIKHLQRKHDNVSSHSVDLTTIYDDFCMKMPHTTDIPKLEVSLVNARARFRMTTLYCFAQMNNYLVVGTGNKVEDFGIGFFTKYGDGGVDISPVADLNKTEVYKLGAALGLSSEIMDAPPTDGLWGDGRTDEEQIGATYPELEWAMDYSGSEDELSEREKQVLDIYKTSHHANKHKMIPIPVCDIPADLK